MITAYFIEGANGFDIKNDLLHNRQRLAWEQLECKVEYIARIVRFEPVMGFTGGGLVVGKMVEESEIDGGSDG